jgi:DNA-directed RNA polymerase subunit RPC12/RpoP
VDRGRGRRRLGAGSALSRPRRGATIGHVATDICQYCGVDLDETPPNREVGYLYGLECSRCPPEVRRSLVLARTERVASLTCPGCGVEIAPAERHPDVLVVKEMTYEVCAACGQRNGVASVRKLRDVGGSVM